jgi:ABC-type nickel/cobalt efflux system permease component RcnA
LSPLFVSIAIAQQHFYSDLVARMGDLKANPWAVWALMGLSFVYGVFHAAGPGHGKAVISGYLVATGEGARRGVVLSFAAAFVQALTAILVVAIAGALLHVTAVTMTAAAEWFEIASYALIALVGAWLLWSKSFGGHHHHHHHAPLPAAAGVDGDAHAFACADDSHAHHDHHGHDHGHDDHGHHHHHDDAHAHDHDFAGVEAIAAAPGRSRVFRAWSAIMAVGIRPCSGALIVLVFALSQGLFLAGVAATLAMAVGTGITVAILAALAVSARGLALRLAGGGSAWTERAVHWAEIGVAAAVLVFGLLMLGGSLAGGVPGSA